MSARARLRELTTTKQFLDIVDSLMTAIGAAAGALLTLLAGADWELVVLVSVVAGFTCDLAAKAGVSRYKRWADRQVTNFNVAKPPPLGEVPGAGNVGGDAATTAATALASALLRGEKWVMVEGESGLGKTTMVRKAAQHLYTRAFPHAITANNEHLQTQIVEALTKLGEPRV